MSSWEDWNYYLGKWTGQGTGQPGEGSGGFLFDFDLNGQILMRRNFAEYPETAERPAYGHDDLMIMVGTDGSRILCLSSHAKARSTRSLDFLKAMKLFMAT